jgi:hypothetical protein
MKLPEKTPHRLVDSVVDGLADGASGLGNSAASAIKTAGEAIMGGLDKPFEAIGGGREGPHRLIDRAAKGIIEAGVNALDKGLLGTAKMTGEAAMKALDQPLEQIKGLGR